MKVMTDFCRAYFRFNAVVTLWPNPNREAVLTSVVTKLNAKETLLSGECVVICCCNIISVAYYIHMTRVQR